MYNTVPNFCLSGDQPSQWRVRLGTSLAAEDGSLHYVSELITHASYNDVTMDYDLVLVKLSSIATLSAFVGVAGIVSVAYNLPDGTKLDALGWGTLDAQGDQVNFAILFMKFWATIRKQQISL